MPWKDPEKQAEYQRRYLADPANKEKRAATTKKNRDDNRMFRHSLLNQFSCVCCGNPDPTVIDWHHVNPEEKVWDIKWSVMRSMDKWWDEVLKCVPVCCNCHRKIHKNKLCLIPVKL